MASLKASPDRIDRQGCTPGNLYILTLYSGYLWVIIPQESLENTINTMGPLNVSKTISGMLSPQMIHCQLICLPLPILKKHTWIFNVGAQNPASLMKFSELNHPHPSLTSENPQFSWYFPHFSQTFQQNVYTKIPPKKNRRNTRKTACARLWCGLGGPNDQSNSRRIPGAAHLNEGSIRRETMEGLTTGCGPLPWRIHPCQDLGLVFSITYLLVSPQRPIHYPWGCW